MEHSQSIHEEIEESTVLIEQPQIQEPMQETEVLPIESANELLNNEIVEEVQVSEISVH